MRRARNERPAEQRAVRQVSARPVGDTFAVRTRGRTSVDYDGRATEGADKVAYVDGCYRRMPTCRD